MAGPVSVIGFLFGNREYADSRRVIIEVEKKRKRKKVWTKMIWITVGIAAALMLFCVGGNLYIKQKYRDRIRTAAECDGIEVDCIMVLGALVYADGRPCHMLEDRLNRGIELCQNGISDRLLMTGDHGQEEYDEVNVMKRYASDAGVPKDCIFMDHAGFSTYDSMYRAKEVFQVRKMVIVTQRYHMPRALYIANELGINAYGVCAEEIRYGGQTMRDIREVAARIKDLWSVFRKAEPKYLGEAIPISGSGDATDDLIKY